MKTPIKTLSWVALLTATASHVYGQPITMPPGMATTQEQPATPVGTPQGMAQHSMGTYGTAWPYYGGASMPYGPAPMPYGPPPMPYHSAPAAGPYGMAPGGTPIPYGGMAPPGRAPGGAPPPWGGGGYVPKPQAPMCSWPPNCPPNPECCCDSQTSC